MTTPAPWQGRYVVYRLFDGDGRLIYVGCSRSLETRIYTHVKKSWFGWAIHRVGVQLAPDRATALAMESEAILTENPRWNLTGRKPRRDWTLDDYLDRLTILDHHAGSHHRAADIRRECETRFGTSERAA